MAGRVLEPSFTMREVLGSDDLEQTYTAVVDRCQGTTGRRQMAWSPDKNYGWCSTAAGFVASTVTSGVLGHSDTANYCDASHSEAPDGRGSATSRCCVEHDKCLTCDGGDRDCRGSWKPGVQCDTELAWCAARVSCARETHYPICWYECSWRSGCRKKCRYYTAWGYDFECATVSTLISATMSPVPVWKPTPNQDHYC